MSTISQNLTRLQTAKTNIANSIIAMGGTVGSGDGFEDFVNDILTIPQGASGITVSEAPTIITNIYDYNIKTILYVSSSIGIYLCVGKFKVLNAMYKNQTYDMFTIGDIQIPWSGYDYLVIKPDNLYHNASISSQWNRLSDNTMNLKLSIGSTSVSPVTPSGYDLGNFSYLIVKYF